MTFRRLLVLAAAVAAAAGARPAAAISDAAGLGCGASDPCVVSGAIAVDNGAVLDLGGRTLEIAPNGRLDVGTGTMTIVAGTFRMRSNSRLFGQGGRVVVMATGDIQLADSTRIDASADVPGSIRLEAGGAINVAGLLDTRATADNNGGLIEIAAGSVTVEGQGRIRVAGGNESVGGLIVILSDGPLVVNGPIDAAGGDSGGSIEIVAGSVATTGRIDISGGPNGSGALLEIISNGAVTIGGAVAGQVGGPTPSFGTAAEIVITAAGPVEVNDGILLSGGSPGGEGGTLEIDATGFTQRAAVSVAGRGNSGLGGDVRIDAPGDMMLGDIDASGATAGSIRVTGTAAVRLIGTLVADAVPELVGIAGVIDVTGCTVDMDTAAALSTLGLGGLNRVRSGGEMVLRGTLLAGENNLLEFQSTAVPPVISGTLSPADAPQPNTTLDLCGTGGGGGGPSTTLPGGSGACAGLADFDALLCRLTNISTAMTQTTEEALGGRRSAKKLQKRLARATTLVEAARVGKPKKQVRKLKAARKQLLGFLKLVRRGLEKGKIDAAAAGVLTGLGEAAALQLDQLRSTP